MDYLILIALFLMFVFMAVFLINERIKKERQSYRSWAKRKLSERAGRRNKHLKTLIERGNVDDVKRYLDISTQGDSLIIMDDEELMRYKK